MMNNQLLEVISYIRNISKGKVLIDFVVLLYNLYNISASNWDMDSFEPQAKGIIDHNYNSLV